MEKWVVTAKKADFQEIADRFQLDPVTARLIRNRDVVGTEEIRRYLQGGLTDLPSWQLLKGAEAAAALLEEKLGQKRTVRIIGDYDIDGVSATCILQKGFRRIGLCADVCIPDRIRDGYGLNLTLVEQAYRDGIDTIVTCDNGIAAASQIERAKELGMTVIVTDHHEIPYSEEGGERHYQLPPADVIINPRQEDCCYPFKDLCGACVALQLIAALYERLGVAAAELEEYLEIAAIATVGDVMDLRGDNRILVKEGLKRLQHTENPGLKALIRETGLQGEQLTAYHIGFVLGPCLNAGGRLETARLSLELLMAETDEEARTLAMRLTALNAERKQLTEKGIEEAVAQVEGGNADRTRVLVVYLPDCHESLAGIIAGRLRERYHKPAFVLTRTQEGVKGSGRSIEAYSMYEELVKVQELLLKFGGHPMAAGLSLEEDQVERFRCRLNECCTLSEEELCEKIVIDVPMPISYIRKELVEEFTLLEPFGKGNRRPLFAQKQLRMLECRIFGKNKNVVKMKVMDDRGSAIDGVYFGDGVAFVEAAAQKGRLDVAYYPSINEYRGRKSLQIVITHYR